VEAVRRRPCSLGLPFSLCGRLGDWPTTWGRADRRPGGVRETVRVHLKAAGIVLSRPQHTITSPEPEYVPSKKGDRRDPRRGLEPADHFYYADEFKAELDAHAAGDVDSEGPEQVMIETPAQPKKR
jgi:hypothetical protein